MDLRRTVMKMTDMGRIEFDGSDYQHAVAARGL